MAAVSTLTDIESEVLRQKVLRLLSKYTRKDLAKLLDMKYQTLSSKICQYNSFTVADKIKLDKIT